MLVLSRKVGERVLIGDKISITVVRVAQNGVRIGIDAPADMIVVREELQDGTEQEVPSATESATPAKPR